MTLFEVSFLRASSKQFTTALMMTWPAGMTLFRGWCRWRWSWWWCWWWWWGRLRVEQLLCPSHLATETLSTFHGASSLAGHCAFRNYVRVFGKSWGALCEKSDSFQRLRNVPRGSPAKSIKVKCTCRLQWFRAGCFCSAFPAEGIIFQQFMHFPA